MSVRDLQENVKDAVAEAVAVIYLKDNSDYLPALYSIVRLLDPRISKLLDNGEDSKAFELTHHYDCKDRPCEDCLSDKIDAVMDEEHDSRNRR